MCENRRTRKSTVQYYDVHDDTESDDDFQSNPSKKTRKEKLSTKSRLAPRLAATENAVASVVVQSEHTKDVLRIFSPASLTSSSSAECLTMDKENVGPSCISIESLETTSLEEKSSGSSTEVSSEEEEEEEACVKMTDEKNVREEVADLNEASTSSGGRPYASTPKWNPPVILATQSKRRGCDRQLPEAIVARGSCTPSGLRLGLSRIAKVKSLHSNVKS